MDDKLDAFVGAAFPTLNEPEPTIGPSDKVESLISGLPPIEARQQRLQQAIEQHQQQFAKQGFIGRFSERLTELAPFAGPINAAWRQKVEDSRRRVESGNYTDDDIGRVAFQHVRDAAAGQYGTGKNVLLGIGKAAQMTVEAGVAQGVVPGGPAGLGIIPQAAVGTARLAGTTALMPSLYAERAQQLAVEKGGSPTDFKNAGPAFVEGMITNKILGSLGPAGESLAARLPTTLARNVARVAGGAVLMPVEQQMADTTTSVADELLPDAYKFNTHYGVMGDLLNGKKGEAGQHFAMQAVLGAIFKAVHLGGAEAQRKAAFETELHRYNAKLWAMSQRGGSSQRVFDAMTADLAGERGQQIAQITKSAPRQAETAPVEGSQPASGPPKEAPPSPDRPSGGQEPPGEAPRAANAIPESENDLGTAPTAEQVAESFWQGATDNGRVMMAGEGARRKKNWADLTAEEKAAAMKTVGVSPTAPKAEPTPEGLDTAGLKDLAAGLGMRSVAEYGKWKAKNPQAAEALEAAAMGKSKPVIQPQGKGATFEELKEGSESDAYRVPDYKNPLNSFAAGMRELVSGVRGRVFAARDKTAGDSLHTPGTLQFELKGRFAGEGKEAFIEPHAPGEGLALDPRLSKVRYKGEASGEDFARLKGVLDDANKMRAERGLEPVELEARTGREGKIVPGQGDVAEAFGLPPEEAARSSPPETAAAPGVEPGRGAQSEKVKIAGAETQVEAFGHAKPIPAKYAVFDLADLKASHSYKSGAPSPTPDYPAGLQPRNYSPRSEEDLKVRRFATEQKAGYYLSTHPGADSGPPTVTPDATVINGNGRVMSLQYGASQGKSYAWYKGELARTAEQFGIDPKQLEGLKRPVLVRVVDMDPRSPEAAQFARAGNVTGVQAQSPVRTAEAMNGLVTKDVLSSLKLEEDTTFSEAVTDPRQGKAFRAALYDALPPAERDRYFNNDQSLTETGKEFARLMLLSKILPVETIERLGEDRKGVKRAIEGAIPQLLQLRQGGQYDIDVTKPLAEAVAMLARNPKVKTVADADNMLSQQSLFGGMAEPLSPAGRMMLDFVLEHGDKPLVFRKRLTDLVKGQAEKAGMFGAFIDEDPKTIAARALGVENREGADFGPLKEVKEINDAKQQAEANGVPADLVRETIQGGIRAGESAGRPEGAGPQEAAPAGEVRAAGSDGGAEAPARPDAEPARKPDVVGAAPTAGEVIRVLDSEDLRSKLKGNRLAIAESMSRRLAGQESDEGAAKIAKRFAMSDTALLKAEKSILEKAGFPDLTLQQIRDREVMRRAGVHAGSSEGLHAGPPAKERPDDAARDAVTDKLLNGEKLTPEDLRVYGGPIDFEGRRQAGVGGVHGQFGLTAGQGPPERQTALANEVVDRLRLQRGQPPLMSAAKKAFGAAWDEAIAKLDKDPQASIRLVDELAQKPRAITDTEAALLMHRQVVLHNEHQRAMEQTTLDVQRNFAEGADEATVSQRRIEGERRTETIERQLEQLDRVTRAAGTETARGLAIRQQMVKESYSLANLLVSRRIAKGGDLTPQERAQVEAFSKRIEDLTAQLHAAEAAAKAKPPEVQTPPQGSREAGLWKKAGEWLRGLFGESNKPVGAAPKSSLWQAADRWEKEATAELSAKLGSGKLFAGFDPTLIPPLSKFVAAKIVKGGYTFAEYSKAIVARFGKDVEPHVADIWRQASALAAKEAAPPSPAKMQQLRIDLRGAKQQWSKLLESDRDRRRPIVARVFGNVREVLNLSRSIVTSLDLSAVLRQGGFTAFSRPLTSLRALPESIRAFASKEYAERAADDLRQRPNATSGLYQRSGLYIAESAGKPSAQEEAYISKWTGKIPGLAGSERSYTTFLNRIRADVFDSMVGSLGRQGRVTEAESKAIANFVNVSTGRGNLGSIERAAVPLAQVFFSPRYTVSRLQLLAGQPLMGGTMRTRKAIAGEYARALAGLGVFYGVAKLAGGDDVDIETDPRSTDFGKLRIGRSRLDPLTGLAQAVTLASRITSGSAKTQAGETVPTRGKKAPDNYEVATLIGRFLRSKLAPLPGAALDVASGKTMAGEPVTTPMVAGNLLIPFSVRDVYESLREQGMPAGAALSILAVFGMGVQSYRSPEEARAAKHRRK